MDEQARSCEAAAVIVPLLYETAEGENWDAVICVASPANDQRQRLADRELPKTQVEQRLAAQMKLPEKMARADYVIFNGGTKEVVREQMLRILTTMLEN